MGKKTEIREEELREFLKFVVKQDLLYEELGFDRSLKLDD